MDVSSRHDLAESVKDDLTKNKTRTTDDICSPLSLQKQCQIGVLPLGTGNDLARVIGWGSVCDDDAHLPQLLERYEKASVKMLDRSVLSFCLFLFERIVVFKKKDIFPPLV